MKRCPVCLKDYFDESLAFCLDDGARLVNGTMSSEPQMAVLYGDRISGESPTQVLGPGEHHVPDSKKRRSEPRFQALVRKIGLPE